MFKTNLNWKWILCHFVRIFLWIYRLLECCSLMWQTSKFLDGYLWKRRLCLFDRSLYRGKAMLASALVLTVNLGMQIHFRINFPLIKDGQERMVFLMHCFQCLSSIKSFCFFRIMYELLLHVSDLSRIERRNREVVWSIVTGNVDFVRTL